MRTQHHPQSTLRRACAQAPRTHTQRTKKRREKGPSPPRGPMYIRPQPVAVCAQIGLVVVLELRRAARHGWE